MSHFPFQLIDLTHVLTPDVPCWEGDCGFSQTITSDYLEDSSVSFRIQKMRHYAGIGTHIDAPAHCIRNGKTIELIKLNDLCASCYVIDVSASIDERYVLSVEDILQFERQYGQIKKGSFVLIYTGWSAFWSEPSRYRNDLSFPCVSHEAALLLVERDIVGLGIDTLSADLPASGFPVHQSILGAGKYLIENIANASQLPAVGAYILALPMLAAGATEAPLRLIALVSKT